MIRRKFERVVVRFNSAVSCWVSRGELRFRLGDVGARHFADVEAVLGLFQRLFEHANVALLNLDDGGIAQIVHVNGGRLQQNGLFEHPQAFARGGNLAFGGAGLIGGHLAVEQVLRDGGADAARRIGAMNSGTHDWLALPPTCSQRGYIDNRRWR